MNPPPQSHKTRKWALYAVFIGIGIVFGAAFIGYPKIIAYWNRIQIEQENEDVMAQIIEEDVLDQTIKNLGKLPEEIEEVFEKEIKILENAYLEVPFVCQSPLQTEENWTYHEESCEEAAVLQVHYYIQNITEPDVQTAHTTILDMIAWQEDNFGEHKDIYANDLKNFINGYYDYPLEDIEITYDANITDIKKAISQGYPVIVPIMGDILHNPYYPYPGYHMLTVIGYTPTNIITNDVGTRRGKDFSYSYDVFMNAVNAAGGDIVIIKHLPQKVDEEV